MSDYKSSVFTALTENGAVSRTTTSEAVLDLFFKTVRGASLTQIDGLVEAAWEENPLLTLRCIFYVRDREGKGERDLGRHLFAWLAKTHNDTFTANLEHIPFYGRWDDVLHTGTIGRREGVKLMANQLLADGKLVDDAASPQEAKNLPRISLAAKWAPTEKHKNHDLAVVLCKTLFSDGDGECKWKEYRLLLGKLRRALNVVERHMCAKDWEEIVYSHVPSCAMQRYKKCFRKQDEERFAKYLEDVKKGIKTMNFEQVMPHVLVREVFHDYDPPTETDPVVQQMWTSWVNLMREKGLFKRTTCMVDTSGSMMGEPMLVAIALGLLISSVAAGPFQGSVLTFETTPHWFSVNQFNHDGSLVPLHEQVAQVKQAPWHGSTNFALAMDQVLKRSKEDPGTAAQTLFVLSDMEFNVADQSFLTNLHAARAKFERAELPFPVVIFWNLRSSKIAVQFPAGADEKGIVMLSGFNPKVLNAIMSGSELGALDLSNVSPSEIMRNALESDRYDRLALAPDDEPAWMKDVEILDA